MVRSSYKDVKKWERTGFNPNEAKAWEKADIEPLEALEQKKVGSNVDGAVRWKDSGLSWKWKVEGFN